MFAGGRRWLNSVRITSQTPESVVEQALQPARAMRVAFAVAGLALSSSSAFACPERVADPTDVSTNEAPATTDPCIVDVDWRSVRRLFEIGYAVGAGGTSRSGIGHAANAFAALDLAYALQFGSDPAQPSAEIELTGSATAHRLSGAIDATGLVTRGSLRVGAARMAEAMVDEGRGNVAVFPLELAHTGELAARPRISTRPELARALYGRERVELATRVLRVEGAGEKASTVAPGETKPRKPSAWAIDLLPLHTGVDIAMQAGTRFDWTVGGALLGVADHSMGAKLDVLGVEYRRIDLPMSGPTTMETVWVLRMDAVDPKTGTGYLLGWGEVIVPDALQDFADRVDPENDGTVTIGGVGLYSHTKWGGFGAQYKREPYLAMTGELGLEDRVSGEVYVPRALGLVARVFGASTKRLIADELSQDFTAGLELDASYATGGWRSTVGLELGRTYYTALDNALPLRAGFVAALGLTVQHSGRKAWTR